MGSWRESRTKPLAIVWAALLVFLGVGCRTPTGGELAGERGWSSSPDFTAGTPASASSSLEKGTDDSQATVSETRELLVRLKPGTDARGVAKAYQLQLKQTLHSDPDMHVMAAASPAAARETRSRLLSSPDVVAVYLNRRSQNKPYPQQ